MSKLAIKIISSVFIWILLISIGQSFHFTKTAYAKTKSPSKISKKLTYPFHPQYYAVTPRLFSETAGVIKQPTTTLTITNSSNTTNVFMPVFTPMHEPRFGLKNNIAPAFIPLGPSDNLPMLTPASFSFDVSHMPHFASLPFLLASNMLTPAVGLPVTQGLSPPKLIIMVLLLLIIVFLTVIIQNRIRKRYTKRSITPLLRFGSAIISACLFVLTFYTFVFASNPLQITLVSGSTYLYPNQVGQEDTAYVGYCLSQAANVTITVASSSGTIVRTIQSGASEQANCSNSFMWNGKDANGTLEPDGVYTASITAVNSQNASPVTTVQLGIDSRIPGALTSPQPYATEAASLNWVFTPTKNFALDSVTIGCTYGNQYETVSKASTDGTFGGTLDSSGCTNQQNSLYQEIQWTDPFGAQHYWEGPDVPITFTNVPKITMESGPQYLYPNQTGQNDTATIYYYLSQDATVNIAIASSSGTVVRTIQQAVSENANFYYNFDWDAKDNNGKIVPDGIYTVKITSQNTQGVSPVATLSLGVSSALPGSLTAPKPNSTAAGSVNWIFTPTSNFSLDSIFIYCSTGTGYENVTTPNTDGTFSGTLDISSCTNGQNSLIPVTRWTDPLGSIHQWSQAGTPITIVDKPKITLLSSPSYFYPNAGQQSTTVNYSLTQISLVSVTISSSSGTVVRTIQSGIEEADNRTLSFSWDGRDNSGTIVPNGVYTATLVAQNSLGQSLPVTIQLGVSDSIPGAITSPMANATASASMNWVFMPSSGISLTSVTIYCKAGKGNATSNTANLDGTFSGSLDVSSCTNGANALSAQVQWSDPIGGFHTWTSPPVPVTLQSIPAITIQSAASYIYPNNGGENGYVNYCLTQNANVTVTIENSSKTVVRTLQSEVSESADCYGSFDWDGRDDSGKIVSNGVYTATLVAQNPDGQSPSQSIQIGVDDRLPGVLSSPTANATVSGTLNWVFTPTPNFSLNSVSVGCTNGGGSGTAYNPAPNGTYTSTIDLTKCVSGQYSLYTQAQWTDPFGSPHYWSGPNVPVTIQAAPVITLDSVTSNTPSNTSISGRYGLSQNASVSITVASSSGSIIRTIQSDVQENTVTNNLFDYSFGWDGRDDNGNPVPDGVYTITITAQNAAGTDTVQVSAPTTIPGVLISPQQNASVSGSLNWQFAPTKGFTLNAVSVICTGGNITSTSYIPEQDGTFTGMLTTNSCTNGQNTIYPQAQWIDTFGFTHIWTGPSVPVIINTKPVVTIYSQPSVIYPNAQYNNATIYYSLSQAAQVTITIASGSGTLVKTIQQNVSENAPYANSYSFTWNGMDDTNTPVQDGIYIASISAVDSAGENPPATIALGVNSQLPGSLTIPSGSATVSANLKWLFTPTPAFNIYEVDVYCSSGGGSDYTNTASADGTFTNTLDVSNCTNGQNALIPEVSWSDEFGSTHYWEGPFVPVTIANTPVITLETKPSYIYPHASGINNTYISYNLNQQALVTVTIASSSGAIVKTIQSEATEYPGYNSFSWDGTNDAATILPDGVYTASISAATQDAKSIPANLNIGVDTRLPGIMTSPSANASLSGLIKFVYTPTSGITPDTIYLYFNTGGSASIYNPASDGTWDTSMETSMLTNGPAVLYPTVNFTDPFGTNKTWDMPAVPVYINESLLPITVAADQQYGMSPFTAQVHIQASDPANNPLSYSVTFGDNSTDATGTIQPPFTPVSLAHTYANPGAYQAVINVVNSAGFATTKTIDLYATSFAPSPPDATLQVYNPTGVAPLAVTGNISGSDKNNDTLTYNLDYGDGSASSSGVLTQTSINHTYEQPGTYTMRLQVNDGPLSTVKTQTITVVKPEALTAVAGDNQVTDLGTPVHFDGSNSRPLEGIQSYAWDFGDGTSQTGAVIDHSYTATGTYTATLTVGIGTQTSTSSATITVLPKPTQTGLITTVTDTNGQNIAGATVEVIDASNKTYTATTDTTGTAALQGLADGSYSVYAYAPNYVPNLANATVTNDTGSVTIKLSKGPLASATLTATRMTLSQIIAAGIDPNDPNNQNVYQFSVNLPFTTITGYMNSGGGFPVGISVNGTNISCTTQCPITINGNNGWVSASYVNNQPQLLWLIVPGKAKWLKEFFNVTMMVSNLAGPAFTLENGSATLPLPDGLSLAPTTQQQTETLPMPDIPGGESASVNWVIRGDTEGEYTLSSEYSGIMAPLAIPVDIIAKTQTPLHVWGASALQFTATEDSQTYAHYPYHVTYSIKNVADVPIYNASIAFLDQGRLNFIYEPKAVLSASTAELDPGNSLSNTTVLVPSITGPLDLSKSFVSNSSGVSVIPSTIAQQTPQNTPATAPQISVTVSGKDAILSWDPVPNATGYEVYSTPDPGTPGTPQSNPDPGVAFSTQPVGTTKASVTSLDLGSETSASKLWYAVRTVFPDHGEMIHPLISGGSTPPVVSSVDVWETSATDPSVRLQQQQGYNFSSTNTANASAVNITINENTKYQTIDGIGASLSEASAYLISLLPQAQQQQLLNDLFNPVSGDGISYLREPMGANDFALSNYSYDELSGLEATDYSLNNFSVDRDKKYIIPLLQEATIINPNLTIMGTPWSAPAWMKTNHSLNGGSLSAYPSTYQTYANYFVKYIQAYEALGIPIDAVTVQNEPGNVSTSFPSMGMSAAQEADFIGTYLGPTLAKAGNDGTIVKPKLVAYDWNWGIPSGNGYVFPPGSNSFYPISVYTDLTTAQKQYLNGFAFHCYGWNGNGSGGTVASQKYVTEQTGKDTYFTECSGTVGSSFSVDLDWDMENLVFGAFLSGAKTTQTFNIALDTNSGPQNGGCKKCRGVVTIDQTTKKVTAKNVEYYVLGQVGKVIQPGAIRIDSSISQKSPGVEDMAFLNTDQSKALIALNYSSSNKNITINSDGKSLNYYLAAGAVVSFKWNIPTPTPTPPPVKQDTGFRPDTNGFGFVNPYVPNYLIPKEAYEQYFGKDVTTTSNGTLTTGALAYYNDFYGVAAQNGECFGITGASAINFADSNQSTAGDFSLPYIKNGYSSVASYSYVPPNAQYKLLDILGYYQGLQYGSQVQYLFQNKENTPQAIQKLFTSIENAIHNGNPIAISLWKEAPNKTHLEGHTLLAYRYEVQGKLVKVYVYDSNHPANNGEYITFSTINNAWYYNPDILGPWGTGVDGNYIQVEPISLYTQKGIYPLFNPQTEDINVPYVVPYITDASGAVTGIMNGTYTNNATGATLLPLTDASITDTPSSQQFVTTLGNTYTVHISNINGTKGPVDFFGNNAYLAFNNLTPNASDSAQIQLGSDGKTATVSASANIASYSATLDQEVNGKSLVFTISNATLSPGETTTFKLVGNNGALSIQDNGSNKTYNLTIQEVGGNNSTETFNNVTITKNMTQTWTPTDWDNLPTAPITLTEDKNSDGKTITTVVANAIVINNGTLYTNNKKVTLSLVSPFSATKMRVSNLPFTKDQSVIPQWQNFINSLAWSLTNSEGKQTVFVQFMAANGTMSDVYSASIILDTLPPDIDAVLINNGIPNTTSTTVSIRIIAQDIQSGIQSMKVSNNSDFTNSNWQSYQSTFNWTVTPPANKSLQQDWIYIQLRDNAGNVSKVFKQHILLKP